MNLVILFLMGIAFLLAGILSAYLYCYKKEIKSMKEQLLFIQDEDTNLTLRIQLQGKELEELATEINNLMDSYRRLGIRFKQTNEDFRFAITNISHDIRTPLTSSVGYLQMLNKGGLSVEKQKEYLQIVEKRVQAVQKMLEQLFEYARLESGELILEKEFISVGNILRDTISMFYNDFVTRKEEPDIEITEKACMILGDKDALKRVFENLIRNAFVHGLGDYKVKLKKEEKEIRMSISNRTNSIEAEDISQIFERFYTTDTSKTKRSTGLGLSIAKRLVEQMGGSISANLKEDQFCITIKWKEIGKNEAECF